MANPSGLAVDSAGNVYFADQEDHSIRRVGTHGIISRVAGSGFAGFSGDGGPATEAQLGNPYDVAVDAAGNLYIADYSNGRIRKVDTSGIITTVAGTGGPFEFNFSVTEGRPPKLSSRVRRRRRRLRPPRHHRPVQQPDPGGRARSRRGGRRRS